MNCTRIRPLLDSCAAGTPVPDPVAAHLRGCPDCRAELEWIARLGLLLQEGLTEADRALLRRPAARRRPRAALLAATAAAAFLAGTILLVLPRRAPSAASVQGAFETASSADGPWRAFDGPLTGTETLRAADDGCALTLHDGSRLAASRGSILSIGNPPAVRSGRFRIRAPRVLLPAGEVRASADAEYEVTVTIKGGTPMRPIDVLLAVAVSAGTADVTFQGETRHLGAGQGLERPAPQDGLADDVAALIKAWNDGERVFSGPAMDRLVAAGRDGLGAVRTAAERRQLEIAREEASLADDLKMLYVRIKEFEGGKVPEELLQKVKDVEMKLADLRGTSEAFTALADEVELLQAWRRSEPALRTPLMAVRSFEHFAGKNDWIRSAACLSDRSADTARDLAMKLQALRTETPTLKWQEVRLGGLRAAALSTWSGDIARRQEDGTWKVKGSVVILPLVSDRLGKPAFGDTFDPR